MFEFQTAQRIFSELAFIRIGEFHFCKVAHQLEGKMTIKEGTDVYMHQFVKQLTVTK